MRRVNQREKEHIAGQGRRATDGADPDDLSARSLVEVLILAGWAVFGSHQEPSRDLLPPRHHTTAVTTNRCRGLMAGGPLRVRSGQQILCAGCLLARAERTSLLPRPSRLPRAAVTV